MAHPIEPTVLDKEDFKRLLKDLENPELSPKAQRMYKLGKQYHRQVHRA